MCLSATWVLNSWEELCIYAYVVAGNSPFECSTHGWKHIYCHPQTKCFFLSQLFGAARDARCFQRGSKPGWIYVSRIANPKLIVSVSEGIFTYLFIYIYAYIYIYIYIYPQHDFRLSLSSHTHTHTHTHVSIILIRPYRLMLLVNPLNGIKCPHRPDESLC